MTWQTKVKGPRTELMYCKFNLLECVENLYLQNQCLVGTLWSCLCFDVRLEKTCTRRQARKFVDQCDMVEEIHQE